MRTVPTQHPPLTKLAHRIGGVIGTGLFLGTAGSLAAGGPLSLLLGHTIVSFACVSVMLCLGEFITLLPVAGGQVTLVGRFVDPALAFAIGCVDHRPPFWDVPVWANVVQFLAGIIGFLGLSPFPLS